MPNHSIEEEVIILKAINELIDSMINLEIFSLSDTDPHSEIRFRSSTHQQFFNILLVDFLSKTGGRSPIKQTTFLEAIDSICKSPNFESAESINLLKESSKNFADWLNNKIGVDAWLPSIGKEVSFNITRASLISICGNISKHNFLRLDTVAKELEKLLGSKEIQMAEYDSLSALSDVYEKLHTDIFIYHSSTIAEFLNNIRWGIYQYLQPEFKRSFTWKSHNPPNYEYDVPAGIKTAFGKECYWRLMNDVRDPPYLRRFQVTEWLKKRY